MEEKKITVKKEFNSDRKILSELEGIFQQIQNSFPLSHEKFHNILVATTEAVINAIQHGNKFDLNKKVLLSVEAFDKKIIIVVQDEGKGFDPSSIEDPRTPENLLKERGRGIFIIRQLANSVSIRSGENGTVIEMRFNI
jgi:serine/threonine-protein kinase RsbW